MPTLGETIEAYQAGDLSGSELAGILRRDGMPPDVVELVLTLHTRAMQNRRVERRLARLWHYRWGEVLGALYQEKTQCMGVLVGGTSVSRYLGPLGKLKWLRDKQGTEAQWEKWSKELREYSMGRLQQLDKRIARVEAMQPPVYP